MKKYYKINKSYRKDLYKLYGAKWYQIFWCEFRMLIYKIFN